METVSLIVKNATIITMDNETRILENHWLIINGSRIVAIEPARVCCRKIYQLKSD